MFTHIRPRRKTRKGRVIDKDFLGWAHETQGCFLALRSPRFHTCRGDLTAHHVRFCGSPKNDLRILMLCGAGHLHDFGPKSIEKIGKQKWEDYWQVSIEAEIQRLNQEYEAQ